ncbi:TIGR01177 family methyltransferase [Halobacteriales archaeon SW_5_68_122]|nr:MAG: TIGR01177 family methyltransferase [Halobacteriales archaeon SW_5_68_122]
MELAGDDDAFALREAESRGSAVEALAPGLATARGVRHPVTLAHTRRVCRLIGTCEPTVENAVALLSAATVDRSGSVAVRARDVRGLSGIDTRAAERRLGAVLVDRGFDVDLEDPDHTLVALFSETTALGWLETETDRGFGARHVAGAGPGARVLDPMCGTGGVLVEAGLVGSDVVGLDAQAKMVAGARENLAHYLETHYLETHHLEDGFAVARGDATQLPFADGAFDGVVFDAPYGRQSKVKHDSLAALVGDALAEARRVAPRAVVVGDRAYDEAAETAGWAVEARLERPVHRSLTRHVHVLR